MSRHVYREVVPVLEGRTVDLNGPVLHVACRNEDEVEFWHLHDTEQSTTRHNFAVFGTGRAEMGFQVHRLDAHGGIQAVAQREWIATGATCKIHRPRNRHSTSATVIVRLAAKDAEVSLLAVWNREEPDEGRNANRWVHRDQDGGRWSVEYGYDGRYWCLFGPGGTPWGELLQNTIAGSLNEATEYIARAMARAKDFDELG